jgi:hypothetical protein
MPANVHDSLPEGAAPYRRRATSNSGHLGHRDKRYLYLHPEGCGAREDEKDRHLGWVVSGALGMAQG